MNNKITIEIKPAYGTNWKYISSEHKEAVKILNSKNTVSDKEIEALKALGFEIEYIPYVLKI